MLHRLLIAVLVLLLPAGALAQSDGGQPAEGQSIEGTWDLRVDNTTIFRFDIEEGEDGEWNGYWHRPEAFNTDGDNFANMRGPVKTTSSMTGIEFLGLVELSFDDPRPGAIPDIFRFKLENDSGAEMTYVGTDLAPYALVRAQDGDEIGEWDASLIYRRNAPGNSDDTESGTREAAPLTLPPIDEAIIFDLPEAAEGEPEEVIEVELDLAPAEAEAEPEEDADRSRIRSDFLEGL